MGDSGADLFICFPPAEVEVSFNGLSQKFGHLMRQMNEGSSLPFLEQIIELGPGDRICIPSGLMMEVPYGYEAQVRPRGGYAVKDGITVLNSPGTVDSGYRGEIGIIVINTDKRRPFRMKHGQKIAQLVIAPVILADFTEYDVTDARGHGAYGSTGK